MAVTINPYIHTATLYNVNTLVNGGSTGAWVLGSPEITHSNSLGSIAYKLIDALEFGKSYRVTYTISSYTNCHVQVYLGDSPGMIRTALGTYVEILTLTGSLKRIGFYSTGTAGVDSYLIEELITVVVDHPLDITNMVNKSWTLSFNPILNQWISFHSYLPNNYIIHPEKLLTKSNSSQLKLSNSGDFGIYFDEDIKPFIIETIFNEYKEDTKVFDSVTVIMETSNSNIFTNTFFDEGIVYTENQCSGTIEFTVGDNVTRKEKNWNFNKFLDITKNISDTIFVSDWDSVLTSYPIDKVVNVNKIDATKPWYQRGRMRDKYLAVRFTEGNLDNTKFTVKFIMSSFRASKR